MSTFIDLEDYDATIHREILDALTRSDEAIVEVCEDQAIAEMRSYLSSRYDCDKIFGKTGSDRHPLILMYAKDIAVYHIFCAHNPYKISEIRKDRYERAVEWLKAVNADKLNIEGADKKEDGDGPSGSPWQVRSNHLMSTHY